MLLKFDRLWKAPTLKSSYDAVIIGGGLHGLAAAYFLASRHGITDVAVIEKKFIGCGAAGRNTAIVRANQRTQENVPLYKEALDLWPVLTKELDFNLMFYNCGNLNLAHSDAALKAFRMHVATAQFHGVEQPAGRRQAVQGTRPGAGHLRPPALPHLRRHVPPPGRDRAPRRRGLGARARRLEAGRAHPPGHRGDRASASRTARSPGSTPTRAASRRPRC